MSSTIGSLGRFGNQLIRGMALHFLAKKNNIKATYGSEDQIKALGIELFTTGEKTPHDTRSFNDNSFFKYIIDDTLYVNSNIHLYNTYCQTKDFSLYLYEYFNSESIKNNIMNHNKYKERYNNNDDLFIHVRLGDTIGHKLFVEYDYYDKCIANIKFNKGYISSDSIEHPICQKLIQKYNLQVFEGDEVETVMFASTCRHLCLSLGTFSWLMGVLGFFSNIFYPKNKNREWHGDIFVIPHWVKFKDF